MARVSAAETRAVLTTRPACSVGLFTCTKSPTRRPFTVKVCSAEVLMATDATSRVMAATPNRSSLIMAPMGGPPVSCDGWKGAGAAPRAGGGGRGAAPRGPTASAVGQPARELRPDGLEPVEHVETARELVVVDVVLAHDAHRDAVEHLARGEVDAARHHHV